MRPPAPNGTDGARAVLRQQLILLLVLSITACSPSEVGAEKFENYLQRLSRVADVEIESMETTRRGKIPNFSQSRTSNIPNGTLSLIDFLSLSGCALQANIARRNTSMGRTASASQKLILDLEFLRLAPACIELLTRQGDAEIAKTLNDNIVLRQTHLKQRLFTALLGGPEWQDFWRIPNRLLNYPDNASGDTAQALWILSQRVARFLDGQWTENDENLEPLLAQLRVSSGGQLIEAARLQTEALTRGSAIMALAATRGAYCRRGAITDVGTVTKTVIAKYFAGDVQAWSAQVSQRHYEIQTPLLALETRLNDVLPHEYVAWRQHREELLEQLYAAPRQHVLSAQALLNNC